MKHAQVRIGEYNIPLIGIPVSATTYQCDRCRKRCLIEELQLDPGGKQFLCEKCRSCNLA